MPYEITKRFHLGALALSRRDSEGRAPVWSATLGARLFGTGDSAAKALQIAASNIMRRAEGLAPDFVPEAGCDAFFIGIDDADESDRLRRENERFEKLKARFEKATRDRHKFFMRSHELGIRLDEARRALALLSPNPPETPAAPEADYEPDAPAVFAVWCGGDLYRVSAGDLPKEPGPLDAAMLYHNHAAHAATACPGSVFDLAGRRFSFVRGPGYAFVWHGRVEP